MLPSAPPNWRATYKETGQHNDGSSGCQHSERCRCKDHFGRGEDTVRSDTNHQSQGCQTEVNQVSQVPRQALGYRHGYRTIVAAMHRCADLQTHYGAQASLNSHAETIGIQCSRRYAELVKRLAMPESEITDLETRPGRWKRDAGEIREWTDDEIVDEAMAIEKIVRATGRSRDYLRGYLTALDTGLLFVDVRARELGDPPARDAMEKFATALRRQLDSLLAGETLIWVSWPETVLQVPLTKPLYQP